MDTILRRSSKYLTFTGNKLKYFLTSYECIEPIFNVLVILVILWQSIVSTDSLPLSFKVEQLPLDSCDYLANNVNGSRIILVIHSNKI